MTNNKFWYLQQVDLFKGISDEEIMKIARNIVEKKCSKKEILYTPFDINNKILLLKKGEVTLYYLHHGKKLIMDVLKPGSIFGNISFEEKNHTHFAEVTEDAYLCMFEVGEFLKILQAKPEVMMRLFKEVSTRLTDYESRLKGGLFDAKEKIIHHLELLKSKKGFFSRLSSKKSRITHEKLAQLTGLSRETVTRGITALRKEGKIINNAEGEISLKPDQAF